MVIFLLSLIPFLAWLYLCFLHGGWRHPFWRTGVQLDKQKLQRTQEQWPSVTALIPARDEVASIWQVIASHMATNYPGDFQILLIDDHSSDGTADLAKAASNNHKRLTIITPPPLPPGWSGKLWALHSGLEHLHNIDLLSDYVLFTDADIVHAPDTLRNLVLKAESEDLALASLMARLDVRGIWGSILIPAFIYFFMKLFPFARSNNPQSTLAAAAGGCMLINRQRLQQSGNLEPIKDTLIDDCALANQLKNTPPRATTYLGLADKEVVSLRDNRSLSSVWNMVARTAYTQLNHSPINLIGTLIGIALIYLLPIGLLFTSTVHEQPMTFWISLLTILLMLGTYLPIIQHYRLPRITIITLPLAAALYSLMTFASAWRYWHGRGGQWKGRHYQHQERGPQAPPPGTRVSENP